MRSLIRERRRIRWVPITVALFQLALVTWIPVADAFHHCRDHPVNSAGESGGGHGDGSGLAPVCFICAAGLGAFTSSIPDLAPTVCSGGAPAADPTPELTPPTPSLCITRARAPPAA